MRPNAERACFTLRMLPNSLSCSAAFFASEPGQAITYQVGKLQILRFLADARLALGARFNLRAFHDALWTNGNVPIALQRWEALGLTDEVELLDMASSSLPT